MNNDHVLGALHLTAHWGIDFADRAMLGLVQEQGPYHIYQCKVKYLAPEKAPNAPVTDFQRLIHLWYSFDPELSVTASLRLVASLQSGKHPVKREG